MIIHASLKTVAITFTADLADFAFFGACLSVKIHCLDCSFVSGVSYESMFHLQFCIVEETHEDCDSEGKEPEHFSANHMVAFVVLCKQKGPHLAEIFFTPNFSYNIDNTTPCDIPVS